MLRRRASSTSSLLRTILFSRYFRGQCTRECLFLVLIFALRLVIRLIVVGDTVHCYLQTDCRGSNCEQQALCINVIHLRRHGILR